MTRSDAAFFKRAIARRMTSLPAKLEDEPRRTDADRAALREKIAAYLESKRPTAPNLSEESKHGY
jgi:hypothetical protein